MGKWIHMIMHEKGGDYRKNSILRYSPHSEKNMIAAHQYRGYHLTHILPKQWGDFGVWNATWQHTILYYEIQNKTVTAKISAIPFPCSLGGASPAVTSLTNQWAPFYLPILQGDHKIFCKFPVFANAKLCTISPIPSLWNEERSASHCRETAGKAV